MKHLYYPTGEPVEPDFGLRERCLRDTGDDRWRVVRGLVWDDGWVRIEVEPGWTTDLASVPRVLQWLLPKRELDVAALFHDDGFRRSYSKDVSDALLRMIAQGTGVAWWKAGLARRGLRWLGWPAWLRHKIKNERLS